MKPVVAAEADFTRIPLQNAGWVIPADRFGLGQECPSYGNHCQRSFATDGGYRLAYGSGAIVSNRVSIHIGIEAASIIKMQIGKTIQETNRRFHRKTSRYDSFAWVSFVRTLPVLAVKAC